MKTLFKKVIAIMVIVASSVAPAADQVYTVTTHIGAGGSSTNIINYLFSQLPGTSVVFDRKPGADGVVAANSYKERFVPAKNEKGTNLYMGGIASAFVMSDISYPGMREYDANDFEMVISLGRAVSMIVASPKSTTTNVRDMQARLARGEHLNIAHVPGMVRAWAVEFSERMGERNITLVPYKSAADVGRDVLGGHVEFAFLNGSTAMQMRESGMKIIAVINQNRLEDLKDVQTVSETLPNFGSLVDTTIVFALPKGTDPKIVQQHTEMFKRVMMTPEAQDVWRKNQIYFTPDDLDREKVKSKLDALVKNKNKLAEILK